MWPLKIHFRAYLVHLLCINVFIIARFFKLLTIPKQCSYLRYVYSRVWTVYDELIVLDIKWTYLPIWKPRDSWPYIFISKCICHNPFIRKPHRAIELSIAFWECSRRGEKKWMNRTWRESNNNVFFCRNANNQTNK